MVVSFVFVLGTFTITWIPSFDHEKLRFRFIWRTTSYMSTQLLVKTKSVSIHLFTHIYRSSIFSGIFLSTDYKWGCLKMIQQTYKAFFFVISSQHFKHVIQHNRISIFISPSDQKSV